MKSESIEKFFGITYRTWQNWKKEGRPVVEFFQKYPNLIDEFLERRKIDELEHFQYIEDPIFEDYVITNLKSVKQIKRDLFNLWMPTREFLTRSLKKTNLQPWEFTPYDAKKKLMEFLENAELSFFAGSPGKKEKAIQFIEENISNIEAYILLKYPEKFTQ